MKDEEMAEEYLQSIEGDDCVIITDREERKQAFLAGLKAKTQWHDLRKDPNDLPEKEDVFLIYTTKGFLLGHYEQGGADGKVDFCGVPYSDFTEYPSEEELVANEVIAWCEIPTFDKE